MSFIIFIIVFAVFVIILFINMSVNLKKDAKNKQKTIDKLEAIGYKISRNITTADGNIVCIDQENRKLIKVSKTNTLVVGFDEIISSEIIENGITVSKNSIGGAVAGGILAGGVGAIIGSGMGSKSQSRTTHVELLITVNDLLNPNIRMTLYNGDGKMSSMSESARRTAEEWNSIMKVILNQKSLAV